MAEPVQFGCGDPGFDVRCNEIENLSRQLGIPIPEHQFKRFACARDQWQNAYGMEKKPADRSHHALQDCIDELADLTSALSIMNLSHVF